MPLETILPVFVPIMFIIIFSVFGYIIYNSSKKAEIEKGKTPLYTERCAGKIGALFYKGPFVRLALYDTFMVIAYTKRIVIPYDQIIKTSVKKRLMSKWIGVHYRDKGQTRDIYVSSMSPDLLKEKIVNAIGG